ncbi:MAG TPA: hypothetical protein PKL15_11550, partial [Saprospiraceae bacterium]|nr:hypothetical protein [Saprospiraceae bacterium]
EPSGSCARAIARALPHARPDVPAGPLPGHPAIPHHARQRSRCHNLHNAAYDPGDKIKAIQLPRLREIALQEFEKGNYVVLGGDWNQCPPYFRFDTFMPGNTQGYEQGNIPDDFFPEDWHFAYDATQPTNRKARDPYIKGETFVTLIDFFLVSPNVRIKKVQTVGQDFQFSDHQPVWLEAELN